VKRREFIALIGGAAVVLPLPVGAQPSAMPVIGYLHFAKPEYTPNVAEFLQGLGERGFVEGRNVALEYRWAEGQYDRLPALAAELVARKVDLIAAFGPPPARAALHPRFRSSLKSVTMRWKPDWSRASPGREAMPPA
jgi:putative ABC transport system substrate-binding protein